MVIKTECNNVLNWTIMPLKLMKCYMYLPFPSMFSIPSQKSQANWSNGVMILSLVSQSS